MNDKELDKLFKEQLEHHPVPPKKDIWQQIESQLDQKKVVPLRKLSWVSYAAMTVGCLGLIALLYNIMIMQSTPTGDIPTIAQKEVSTRPTNTAQEPSRPAQPVIPVVKGHSGPSKQQEVAKTEAFVQKVSMREHRNTERLSRTEERRLELVELKPAGILHALTADLHIDDDTQQEYVISVPPVAPLIDSPETEESMLASTRKPAEGIVPGILNKISDALNPTDNATIQFSNDEEGFLRLDIVNSLVKNRNKKRR
jgi:hypothetical protein